MTITTVDLLRNFAGGSWTEPAGNGRTQIVDPATGRPYAEAPLSRPEDVDAAFDTAERGFASWRDTTPRHRSRMLSALADEVEARTEQFVDAECRNTGKPRQQMRGDEVPAAVDILRFFADAARVLAGSPAGEYVPGHTSLLRREPVGVVAAITPWSHPLVMATRKIAPALAAGNAVVLKPAETTPVTSLLLAELAAEFLPAGVVNVICGDRATGAAMVEHPAPAMVTLTGSAPAGSQVAAAAGAQLKRVHLQLGGMTPVLVFDDADLELAVPEIARAGYGNAGQSGTAASRVLACPAVYDDFVAALADAAAASRVGGPDEDAEVGPVNNPHHLARVAGYVDRRAAYAEVVAGGHELDRSGFFYAPTVVTGVHQRDELVRERVFGPVITVQRVADEEQAVALANDSEYGLAGSVWTRDHARALRVSRQLEVGTVWVNCHSVLAAEMPNAGAKASGHGSDLSAVALADYTRVKHVLSRL